MTMPLLRIQTNAAIDNQTSPPRLKNVSQRIAEALDIPEQYMMVSLQADLPMMFADVPANLWGWNGQTF